MLPRIKINFLTGQLGKVGTSPDGLVAFVAGSTAVKKTFELGKAYLITQLSALKPLGVTKENNALLYGMVQDFYRQAPEGTELVIYGVEKTKTMTELCSKEEDAPLRKLLESENGKLRALFVASEGGDSESVTEGLSPDVFTALPKAQDLSEFSTNELYAPIFIVLDGRGYTGANLRDLSETAYNRVGVFVGSSTAEDKGSTLGTLAGRVATVGVQRNVGRVRDGALKGDRFFLAGKSIEEKQSAIMELHNKRYITIRKYVGRTGYFLTDDNLATPWEDDYGQIANRRVIDKAYRITYQTLLDFMLDDLELNADGTMQAPVIRSWEQAVEGAINSQMTARGELSSEDGSGCKCYIEPTQNVVSSSRINISLKVRPHGYARYIDVNLGFLVSGASNQTE